MDLVGWRLRLAASAAVFGLVAAPSYAVQRLIDALSEPPIGTVLQQAYIPYYWRVALAVLHGGSAALIAAFLLRDEPAAERLLAWLPRLIWPAILLSAAAMGLRP